ncbi:C-type lectin domain family 4 member F-like [Colossoma macropomum]|uniref:C-type lectin domain family 4 member F-like n=1 Tax=Colossoma macropomum TaxID=42526 RepID=UPI0018644593|nr:C-type lectin domain family 4 member F-like [Colossoma macropomum]
MESESVKTEDVYQTLHHPPSVKNPNPTHGSPQSIRLIMILLIFNTLLLIIILILTGTFKSQNRMLTEESNSSSVLLSPTLQSAVTSCKPGWTQHLSRCYLFSNDSLNWHQAREYCRTQNASLLKVETEAEWAFITANSNEYWIGLTDEITGRWRWTDGTRYVMDRKKWGHGQPDNWSGDGPEGEHCAHLRYRKLNDLHCKIRMNYICKQ